MTRDGDGRAIPVGADGSDRSANALRRRPVLVGVDDSPATAPALTWAATQAHALGVPLHVLGAYVFGLLDPWISGPNPLVTSQLRRDCLRTVRNAVASAKDAFPDLIVTGEAVEADPRDVLVERGRDASMVVVGTRHIHALGRAVLGSVSTALTVTAPCPVVVLCGAPGLAGERPAVVAGVTGDAGTDDVLAFAFAQAELSGLPLHAVMCWRPDAVARNHREAEPPPPERAERWLAEALAGWREEYPAIDVHAAVLRDHAVSGLVWASASQHLLVVGRHGHRNKLRSMLGSVSQGVLHHALCPVAVVPPIAP